MRLWPEGRFWPLAPMAKADQEEIAQIQRLEEQQLVLVLQRWGWEHQKLELGCQKLVLLEKPRRMGCWLVL